MQVLRAADRTATPWKNGGGVTREVAAWPPGAGFEDFRWRVSTAQVREDGPFSLFPGVDRILTVLSGRLVLSFDGRADLELGPDSAPASFPGDVAIMGRVPNGPVSDLNVMTRRAVSSAAVTRVDVRRKRVTAPASGARLVLVRDRVLARGSVDIELEPDDAVLLAPTDQALTLYATDATVYVVDLTDATA